MSGVSIESIDTFQLRIPLDIWAPPPMFAGKPRTHVEAIYVRVKTNKGVTGWGECFGSSGQLAVMAFDKWIRPLAVGKDPSDPNLMPTIERLLHDLLGHRMPVAHADITAPFVGVALAQCLFQRTSLCLGLAQNGRAAADLGVDAHRLLRAAAGNEACQGQPQPTREIDDRRIAEQVAQERLHCLQRIRAAQIEQDDRDFHVERLTKPSQEADGFQLRTISTSRATCSGGV